MSRPMDLASCLVFAAPRASLAIVRIPFDALRRHLDALGLREGDHASVAHTRDGHAVLEKPDGTAVLVDRRHAALIEVRLIDDAAAHPAASRRRSADRRAATESGATVP